MFAIEKIIGKGKDESGAVVYRVKWEGYPESEATWEPLAHLEGNPLLEQYEQTLQLKSDDPPGTG